MEAADHRRLDETTPAGILHRSWLWGVLRQSEMGPGTVIVEEVVTAQATQMGFVQHHDVIEALAAYGADEAFDIGFCHGDRGAIFTSWIPSDSTWCENTAP